MSTPEAELRQQWGNPRDILSLLLLLGGDIVQKAIAQLVGHQVRPFGQRGPTISVAPVAFSFGWVAYGFSSLLAAFGDMALMPACDHPCVLVNCSTGFARENRSWALGRLLRDHEIRHVVDPRPVEEGGRAESLRVDIFELLPVAPPARDLVWWLGWVTLFVQVAIAIVPWAVYGDWSIALVTLCGSLLALVTCAMPQWVEEKWTARRVEQHKVTCLTRGNGSQHVMVFIAAPGAWDLENVAAGSFSPQPETRAMALGMSIMWTCLLISVSGIQHHTWYLVCIGGIGMLQNLFAAGAPRSPQANRFHLRRSTRAPAVVGIRQSYQDLAAAEVNLTVTEDGLAELALWVSDDSQPWKPSETGEFRKQSRPMPKWIVSMSRKDGVPHWLEPVHPHVVAGDANMHPSAISVILSRTCKGGHENDSAQKREVHVPGVHGALIELEKWVPTAGLAMLEIFFPRGLAYNDTAVRDNVHKRFWRQAYHTKDLRRKTEVRRRQQYRAAAVI
ncbi:hypothetical protein N8I77_005096 [Diaporthe amygdali]|uniref:Uncharacterized protein n=1 Tax=Phomopsis amygdali TaxID=1214568 RepID=A0AAD9SPS5_PHOAM|nr:hypothetical protein N8I77_005096 [Diaporthe amygdali]